MLFGLLGRGRLQGPTINLINKGTLPLGIDLQTLAQTLQAYIDSYLQIVWGVSAEITTDLEIAKGSWGIVLLDDPDVASVLGYHDLTEEGLPLSKVFLRAGIDNQEQVSVTASHELAEMLIDPALNLCVDGQDGLFYAYEICDPVEEETFLIKGVPVSDFVYPTWFEPFHQTGSTKFDEMGKVDSPFKVLPKGYIPVWKDGGWTHIFASGEKREAFLKEDRRGHRSDYRKQRLLPK